MRASVASFVTWRGGGGRWSGPCSGGTCGGWRQKSRRGRIGEGAWAEPWVSGRVRHHPARSASGLGRWWLAPLPVCSVCSVTIDGQVWGLAEASAPRFRSPSSPRAGCGPENKMSGIREHLAPLRSNPVCEAASPRAGRALPPATQSGDVLLGGCSGPRRDFACLLPRVWDQSFVPSRLALCNQ